MLLLREITTADFRTVGNLPNIITGTQQAKNAGKTRPNFLNVF